MSQDQRLIDLESRIAHQEHTIQTLGDELYEQQKKLEQLESTCKFLLEQLRTRPEQAGSAQPDDEVPPHY